MAEFDLTGLTLDELQNLQRQVSRAISNTIFVNTAVDRTEASLVRWHSIQVQEAPVGEYLPWVQPAGAHDAYPEGWIVTHGGKEWKSTTPANVWEPGVTGWREVTDDTSGEYPEWVQPLGAHDAYQAGDKVVFNDRLWQSMIAGNVWQPGTDPKLWIDLGDYTPPVPDEEEPPVEEPPVEEPEEPTAPEWQTGVAYVVGDIVMYNGQQYRCIQAHTSQEGWSPSAVPALWGVVT